MPFQTTWSAIKDFVNGGKVYPQDLDDAFADLGNQLASVNVAGGFNEGTNVRRGKCVVSATESRTNTAYGLLTTPDQVLSLVVPQDSLIIIGYQAWWKESVAAAARAAIFVGSDQLRYGGNTLQEATLGGSNPGFYAPLTSYSGGLGSVGTFSAADTPVSTTPRAFSGIGSVVAGFAIIDPINAGPYNISVQFKSSSGSLTVKNRKLFVEVRSYV